LKYTVFKYTVLKYIALKYIVKEWSKPLLAVRYESQVFTAIWTEQLSKEGRELMREESLYTGNQHVLYYV
jgi:hypothetical protein